MSYAFIREHGTRTCGSSGMKSDVNDWSKNRVPQPVPLNADDFSRR
jgi:hypothetical protein